MRKHSPGWVGKWENLAKTSNPNHGKTRPRPGSSVGVPRAGKVPWGGVAGGRKQVVARSVIRKEVRTVGFRPGKANSRRENRGGTGRTFASRSKGGNSNCVGASEDKKGPSK